MKLERIKDMLCDELEKYEKKSQLSGGDLEAIHKLTDTIKNIDKIDMLEEGGYSQAGDWTARVDYGHHGESYRRRDRMGRYSRDGEGYHDGMSRDSYRGYSRDGARGYMMEQLEEMMENAESSKEKDALKRCMDTLRTA